MPPTSPIQTARHETTKPYASAPPGDLPASRDQRPRRQTGEDEPCDSGERSSYRPAMPR